MKFLETQAFPVHAGTIEGVLTDQPLVSSPYHIVHAQEAGTLTINYTNGVSKTVSLLAGEDIVLVGEIDTITTSGVVKVS